MPETKVCTECGKVKKLSEFYEDSRKVSSLKRHTNHKNSDSYRSQCKECVKEEIYSHRK